MSPQRCNALMSKSFLLISSLRVLAHLKGVSSFLHEPEHVRPDPKPVEDFAADHPTISWADIIFGATERRPR